MTRPEAERRVRDALERLTGFSHAVFVQTGTAALEIVLSVLTRPNGRVAIPALGCWTVAFAVTKLERRPRFLDVDAHWGARLAPGDDASLDAAILIDPWGGPAGWKAAARRAPLIADLTLGAGALLHGEPAGAWATAGVASLGSGKPLGIGGGGVALFRHAEHAREATELFRFGFQDGRWQRRVDRYAFSPLLFEALADKLDTLPAADRRSASAARVRARIAAMGFASNTLRAGGTWGHTSTFPILLPRSFPLAARDIEGAAVASGVRLARHPVAPPYLEKAWTFSRTATCPRAEDIGARTIFAESVGVDAVARVLESVASSPEEFRTPFPLPRARGALPTDLERLVPHARLVRKLDRTYGLLEESQNLMWPIDEREAALVQTAQRAKTRTRLTGARVSA